MTRILAGLVWGGALAPAGLDILGFVLGGIGRAAPCHEAHSFIDGALFGAFAVMYLYGLPAIAVGAVIGGVVGFFRH